MLGYQELLIIFVLVLLFFGGKKIPEVARGLGKGLKEFKKAKDGITESIHDSLDSADDRSDVASDESDKKSDEKSKNQKDS
jgi:sec-independent protein translocase protein TatA